MSSTEVTAAPDDAARPEDGSHPPEAAPGDAATSSEGGVAESAQEAAPTAGSDSERRRKALKSSAADMVRSMIVILAVVGLLYVLVPRPERIERPEIDVTNAAAGAADQLDFTPAVPSGLPAGWVPTRASVVRGSDGILTWAIVYRTPDGGYGGMRQAADVTADWEDTQVVSARETGRQDVGGVTWIVRNREDRGAQSLVHRGDDVTTVVTTQGTDADVATLAAAVGVTN